MRSLALLLLSNLPVGEAFRAQEQGDITVSQGVENDVDEDSQWGRFRCPHGLEANATAQTCIYHGEMVDDPDKGSTVAWAGGSKRPLVFKSWGGLENAEGELVEELRFMLTQPEFVRHMVHMSHEHMSHGSSEGVIAGIHGIVETVEANSENLAAVEFVGEHAAEHLVIETLAFGLTHLAEIAVHGGLAMLALEGAAVGLEVVGAVLAHPVVLGASAVHTAFLLRRHFISKDARARSFAVGLVSKADCLASKITLHHEQILDEQNQILDENYFVPELRSVCGLHVESELASQMLRTNMAMINLFNEFKGIGKCIFPEGPRAWSKSNCVHAIYEPLRSYEGESGILYSAFSLAAAYGQETDELLSKPIYSEWFERYFNISLPHSRIELVEASTMQETATTCITIVGLHRAFERLFVRLKTALNIYMHTFARDRLHLSTRTVQHPCRRVFREFEDRADGLCKDGTDMPLVVPDTEWLREHAQHLSDTMLDDVGSCIEDTYPELAISLSLSNSGPEEGENEQEEHEGQDEE